MHMGRIMCRMVLWVAFSDLATLPLFLACSSQEKLQNVLEMQNLEIRGRSSQNMSNSIPTFNMLALPVPRM